MRRIKGYIICETGTRPEKPVILKESEIPVKGTGRKSDMSISIRTTLQEAEAKNRNKRIYTQPVLNEGLGTEYVKERLLHKSWYGEAGHPLKPDVQRQLYLDQGNISHIVVSYNWEGNLLKGIVESADTTRGLEFRNLIKQGSDVAFSLRAVGPITENRGGTVYVKSPLTIFCYDWVIHPSHAPAYMEGIIQESSEMSRIIVNESTEVFVPLYEKYDIEKYLRESSRNINIISEQFEIDKKSAYLSENMKEVYMKGKDEVVVFNVDDYLISEMNSHLLKLKR